MKTPADCRYAASHEWVHLENGIATVGITDFAQHSLGDLTYIELPPVGKELARAGEAAVVESCKAAASVYAPLAGKVIEINRALDADPGLLNADPYGKGWLFRLQAADPTPLASLMDAAQYAAHTERAP